MLFDIKVKTSNSLGKLIFKFLLIDPERERDGIE